jgi:hypothetical protein
MDVLFKCFVTGLIAGIPIWILMQYFRPRVGFIGLPVFGGPGQVATDIQPVVLNGRFVANIVKPQS